MSGKKGAQGVTEVSPPSVAMGEGTSIWKGRGCSSEKFELSP